MSYIVEKFVNKSSVTKFSLVYTTQIVCTCDDDDDGSHRKCQNRVADDRGGGNGSLSMCYDSNGVVYEDEQDSEELLSIDCIKQNMITSSFSVFYSQSKSRNKTFVVAKRSEDTTPATPLTAAGATQFFTCGVADFEPLTHVEPYSVKKVPNQPNLNDLIIVLNGLDRNGIIKIIRELKTTLQQYQQQWTNSMLTSLFKTLNKSLFSGFLTRLEARWSRDIKQKSEFDIEETCEEGSGKLVWFIKLNQDYFHNQPSDRLIVQLLIEMCLAFVNITLCTIKIGSLNEEIKIRNIFTNQVDFLLEQYEYLTSMDLKSSFVRENCAIYRYKITEKSLYLMSKPLHESTLNPSSDSSTSSLNEFKFLILSLDEDLESSSSSNNSSDDYEQTITNTKVNSLLSSTDDTDTLVATASNSDGDIIQLDTIYLQNSVQYDNLVVESPYNKRDLLDYNSSHHHYHLLHNNKKSNPLLAASAVAAAAVITTTTSVPSPKSTVILDYIKSLREEGTTQMNEFINSNNGSEDAELMSYKPGRNDSQADSKVRALRNKLYSFLLNTLDALIQSETLLKQFRERFILILDRHDSLSAEEFVNEAFHFFNSDLFAKLLTASTVTIEWSHRLKSSAAATVLVKNSIVIRLSVNILSKLDKIESIKMLLHEMIHSYLGVAIGDFDDKHGSNFNKILHRINRIVKLDIPIEHDYYETLELAYIWECNKCDERRVRFYDVPPTENQKERHEEKCDGKFVLIKHPNKRTS